MPGTGSTLHRRHLPSGVGKSPVNLDDLVPGDVRRENLQNHFSTGFFCLIGNRDRFSRRATGQQCGQHDRHPPSSTK
jgi:hypothetical protein